MENEIMKKITTGLYTYISTTNVFSKKNLGVLLEPINTMVKLSLLQYFEKGTKISIQNNVIIFQEPNSTQGFTRWSKGDKYEDLHNLVNPIKKFISSKKKNRLWNTLDNFDYLCEEAIKGLIKLSDTYENNKIANHTINFYKSLIEEQNNGHFLDKLETEDQKMFDIYEEFFLDWEVEQINILVHLLKNLKSEKTEIKKAYLLSIENIIEAQDFRMKKIIEKVQSGIV